MNANPEVRFAAGAAALEANDLAGAEQLFRSIVLDYPEAHAAWNALSVVAARSGFPDLAMEHARRALDLDRRNSVYLNNLAIAYGELGRFEDAEATLRRALKLRPVYAEGMFNLGKVLHKRGRLVDSLRAYERAYAMEPEFPGLRANLAQMYKQHGRAEDALAVLQAARAKDELLAVLMAECLSDLQGPEAAMALMRRLLEAHPEWLLVHQQLGAMLLALGRWREGWKSYLLRPMPAEAQGRRLVTLPARLAGKRVLLRSEQGLGDVLFFARFAASLRERGAAVSLSCWPRLMPLLRHNPLFDELLDSRERFDERRFDHVVWLGDLPALLEADGVLPPVGVHCEPEERSRMRLRLAQFGPPPYLALTWRAGTDVLTRQEFGKRRDLLSKDVPLEALGAAVRGWRGTLLGLQRHARAGEMQAIGAAAGAAVHDLSMLDRDLGEIVAALELIDEYVTVSNTNVHLLAGLGKVARVLVPYPPDFRWMLSGAASPWFPGCPVYRHPPSRDWSGVFAHLKADLEARV